MKNIAILCSGIGLGFYVPGLILKNQLVKKKFNVQFFVYESLLLEDKQQLIPQMKKIFMNNFHIANISQKLLGENDKNIDQQKKDVLLKKFHNLKIDKIICFSGFWLPIILEYSKMHPKTEIDYCHVDSVNSVSWSKYNINLQNAKDIFFNSFDEKRVNYKIEISNNGPIEFSKRKNRIYLHGGGWNIGNYMEIAKQINKKGINFDITLNNELEIQSFEGNNNNNYFLLDSDWHPWNTNEYGEYIFSPVKQLYKDFNTIECVNYEYPVVYDYIRKCKAIVSKPGGGTLIDSFSSSTPLVFLNPYGKYEEQNGKLWETLGYGISFDVWKSENFSIELLEKLHLKLLQDYNKTTAYINTL